MGPSEVRHLRERERERNVLFNDALNTFYLRLYGVGHMVVKDHSDSEKGNPLPPHRLLLSINSKGSFICTIPQTGLHIPRPLLHQSWLEREIAQWDHLREDKPLLLLLTVTGRKEMFYLTTHSTHFYLRLYGVRHMVKDHSDSEKGNLLPPHRLLFID